MNFSLDREDFVKLIRGEVVEKYGHKILLQDIGYDIMTYELESAKIDFVNGKKKKDG